ncbi:HAD-IA family hydrolase [Streptomyces sp. NPDC051784]|uniref:HAD family hydrolase n=1 Tax=Streptomyces sp. NPDC051784 TaxID=3155805 RepID=UPI00342B3BEF
MSAPPAPSQLEELLRRADCVLFDFDGPLCHLFAGRPAPGVAARLAEALPGFDCDPQVTAVAEGDPLALLRAVHERHGDSETTRSAERFLAKEEVKAIRTAAVTPHALELIRALEKGGWKQAVTTNNSADAVTCFLELHGMAVPTAEHIHGRGALSALKPDPHCLVRALESTGSRASTALMIGDSRADFEAAAAIGVPFIGYVPKSKRGVFDDAKVYGANVCCTVDSLLGLVRAADPGWEPSAQQASELLSAGVRG